VGGIVNKEIIYRDVDCFFDSEGNISDGGRPGTAGFIMIEDSQPCAYLYSGRFAYEGALNLIGLCGLSADSKVTYLGDEHLELTVMEAVIMANQVNHVFMSLFQNEEYEFNVDGNVFVSTPFEVLVDFVNVRNLKSVTNVKGGVIWSLSEGWSENEYHQLVSRFVSIINESDGVHSEFTDLALEDGLSVMEAVNSWRKGEGLFGVAIKNNLPNKLVVELDGHPRVSKLILSANVSNTNNACEIYFDKGDRANIPFVNSIINTLNVTQSQNLLDY
jgi:hypothetical protein